jgi:hypothetical protein
LAGQLVWSEAGWASRVPNTLACLRPSALLLLVSVYWTNG